MVMAGIRGKSCINVHVFLLLLKHDGEGMTIALYIC